MKRFSSSDQAVLKLSNNAAAFNAGGRGHGLSGALSGITSAVVGVILNLALIFGAAVIAPHGLSGNINWFAAIMSAAAFFALYKLKIDVLWVVLVGGLIGLAKTFFLG